MADIKKLSPKNGHILIISSVLLVLAIVVSLTAAFLHESTPELKNTFTPAFVACEVEENYASNYKTSVKVKVDDGSGVNAYIRLSIVGNKVDESGNTIANYEPEVTIKDANWVYYEADGYYYYTLPVAPGDTTGELLNRYIEVKSDERIDICAEAIQATPADAVQGAWGVTISEKTVTPVSGN